ncbi:hypothetical protein BT69DRAFT_1339510 [Atractiella rhizophila]|nr:hypothetical protein BT69DRAFT_1339510 [Atractiella rhizophila]
MDPNDAERYYTPQSTLRSAASTSASTSNQPHAQDYFALGFQNPNTSSSSQQSSSGIQEPAASSSGSSTSKADATVNTSTSPSTAGTIRPPSWPLVSPPTSPLAQGSTTRPRSTPIVLTGALSAAVGGAEGRRMSEEEEELYYGYLSARPSEDAEASRRQSYQTTISASSQLPQVSNQLLSRFSSNTSAAVGGERSSRELDGEDDEEPTVPSIPRQYRFSSFTPEDDNAGGGRRNDDIEVEETARLPRQTLSGDTRRSSLPPGADPPRVGFMEREGRRDTVLKDLDKEERDWAREREETEVEETRFRDRGLVISRTEFSGSGWRIAYYFYTAAFFAPIPLTIFFDFNVLYSLVQIAIHPSSIVTSTSSSRPSRGWYLCVGVYALCFLLWLSLVIIYEYLVLYRRTWKSNGGHPTILSVYLSAPTYRWTCVRSFHYFSFLTRLRLSVLPGFAFASVRRGDSRDGTWTIALREEAGFWVQNWPIVITLLPRIGIATGVLLVFAPSNLAHETAGEDRSDRDATFFGPTGDLTPYAAITILAYVSWGAVRVLVVLISAILLALLPKTSTLSSRLRNIILFCSTTSTSTSKPTSSLLSSRPHPISIYTGNSIHQRPRLSSQQTNDNTLVSPTDTNHPLWASGAGSIGTRRESNPPNPPSSLGAGPSYEDQSDSQPPLLPPHQQSQSPASHAQHQQSLHEAEFARVPPHTVDTEQERMRRQREEEEEQEEMRIYEYEQRRTHYTQPALSNIMEEGSEDQSWRRKSGTSSHGSADTQQTSRSFPPRPEAPTPASGSEDESEREQLQ